MNGVLVDTSVLIDYFASEDSWISVQAEKLDKLRYAGIPVYTCLPVYQEYLQGIKSDAEFIKMKTVLPAIFPLLEFDSRAVCDKAVSIYRELRKKGVTIRKPNDCLIAAYALFAGVAILHKDRDFDFICGHTGVEVYWELSLKSKILSPHLKSAWCAPTVSVATRSPIGLLLDAISAC